MLRNLFRHNITLSGLLALWMAFTLTACGPGVLEDAERADVPVITTASAPEPEYVPGSEDGPAQHVPEPVVPDAVTAETRSGLRATLHYFWEAVDYGRKTGQTEPIEEVTHYHCENCNQIIYRWEQIYAEGSWAVLHEETAIEILEIQEHDGWMAVIFEMDEPASDMYMHGDPDQKSSVEGGTSTGWWVEMVYNEQLGQWQIDWLDYDETLIE